MATITAAMVKELRDRTGLGMMDCKRALTAADGDLDRAIDDLRRKSALKAAAKASRTAAEGLLALRVADDRRKATLVEVNIETDFAARHEKFAAFLDIVAEAAFAAGANDVDGVMTGALEAQREALVQEIGENVTVRRAVTFENPGGHVASYLHTDRRKGALVELEGGDDVAELGRDLAMHVTAAAPEVVHPDDLDAAFLAKEREILEAQAIDSGKPPEIAKKMVEGRLRKTMGELSLVEQPFVKDPSTRVGKRRPGAGAPCNRFARIEVGEGSEKKADDFAAEVAAQAGTS
ncbi:MAG: elongation factor Ts [Gammaproteobacteria bacterium]|nr:elongation factor Ts [Gammaproteobacteria bacterium]